MFIVKFQGALGNQMFEYAFMEKLKKVYPNNDVLGYVPIIKDFNGYEIENVFNISINKANWKQVAKVSNDYPQEAKHYKFINSLSKLGRVVNGPKYSHIRQDDNSCYYKEVFELSPLYSYYLDGVWANSEYIKDLRDELMRKFEFKSPLTGDNLLLANEMNKGNSVCIHVRRNEYVTMGLSVASDEYYRNAISIMKEKIDSPSFYVFSDDHKYCRELFDGLIDYKLVEGNTGTQSYRDMQLMTFCKHNIVANSTFSFWGAFLGKNEDKVVIAPNLSWGNMRSPFAMDNWVIISTH